MWTVIITAIAFLAGALMYGKKRTGKDVKKTEEVLREERRSTNAARLRLRLINAQRNRERREADARESMGDRRHSGDVVADLRDRLDR
ncbi:MAG: hypothetical protein AMJ55_00335 [Gammaproteobacteria bacterium SG8_15]|nr:MAG: hypothetical protein AMJ55_00335 [Gammaproteobacteria bacterium SG8_15]